MIRTLDEETRQYTPFFVSDKALVSDLSSIIARRRGDRPFELRSGPLGTQGTILKPDDRLVTLGTDTIRLLDAPLPVSELINVSVV